MTEEKLTKPVQVHTHLEPCADARKYEVGRQLRFIGVQQEPIDCLFSPGDLVTVDPENGCGMGIDVTGLHCRDMVWPEEVEVIE